MLVILKSKTDLCTGQYFFGCDLFFLQNLPYLMQLAAQCYFFYSTPPTLPSTMEFIIIDYLNGFKRD